MIDLPDRQWPSKTISTSPQWCSVDLRDGNQALPCPLNPDQKLEYFKLLCGVGFKHIEVAFPSASQDDFDFTRRLIVALANSVLGLADRAVNPLLVELLSGSVPFDDLHCRCNLSRHGSIPLHFTDSLTELIRSSDPKLMEKQRHSGGGSVSIPPRESSLLVVTGGASPSGSIRVEIRDADGTPMPTFSRECAASFAGNTHCRCRIHDGTVCWPGQRKLNTLRGRTIRLRFDLTHARLFTFEARRVRDAQEPDASA